MVLYSFWQFSFFFFHFALFKKKKGEKKEMRQLDVVVSPPAFLYNPYFDLGKCDL